MGFLINDIITLDNNENYIVVDTVQRFDDKYYYIVGVDKENDKLKNNCRVVKVYENGDEQYVSLVDNKDELRYVIPLFLSHYT